MLLFIFCNLFGYGKNDGMRQETHLVYIAGDCWWTIIPREFCRSLSVYSVFCFLNFLSWVHLFMLMLFQKHVSRSRKSCHNLTNCLSNPIEHSDKLHYGCKTAKGVNTNKIKHEKKQELKVSNNLIIWLHEIWNDLDKC